MSGWFTLVQAAVVDMGLYTTAEWRERELKQGIELRFERATDCSTPGMVGVHTDVDGVPKRIGFLGLTQARMVYELLRHGYVVKCELAEHNPLFTLPQVNVQLYSQNGEL